MDYNPDFGCKIQDNWYGRSMVIMKLNLVKGKAADKAADATNENATSEDNNH